MYGAHYTGYSISFEHTPYDAVFDSHDDIRHGAQRTTQSDNNSLFSFDSSLRPTSHAVKLILSDDLITSLCKMKQKQTKSLNILWLWAEITTCYLSAKQSGVSVCTASCTKTTAKSLKCRKKMNIWGTGDHLYGANNNQTSMTDLSHQLQTFELWSCSKKCKLHQTRFIELQVCRHICLTDGGIKAKQTFSCLAVTLKRKRLCDSTRWSQWTQTCFTGVHFVARAHAHTHTRL